jgi:sporulation protein YlmC with PRC-barrel domain
VIEDQGQRDDGIAVHYSTIAPGTPIYGSDGVEVGKVVDVSDNKRENILDGFIFEDSKGETKFVDAPEVQHTYERAVQLNIDSAAAAQLEPPPKNSRLGGLFRR